jgi:hypothetical protein
MGNDTFVTLITLFALGVFLLATGIKSFQTFSKKDVPNLIAAFLGSIIIAFSTCLFLAIQFPKYYY